MMKLSKIQNCHNVFLTRHKKTRILQHLRQVKVYIPVFILFIVCTSVQYFFDCSEKSNLKKYSLKSKDLRNYILRIIRVWPFFLSKRVYLSLYFLPIILGNKFFIFLCFPCSVFSVCSEI